MEVAAPDTGGMKIFKISLPIIIATILFSAYANNSLKQTALASADAGALPETTAILQKMQAKAFRQAANAELQKRDKS